MAATKTTRKATKATKATTTKVTRKAKAKTGKAFIAVRSTQCMCLYQLTRKQFAEGASQGELQAETGIVRISQAVNTGREGKVLSLVQRQWVSGTEYEVEGGRSTMYYSLTAKGKTVAKKVAEFFGKADGNWQLVAKQLNAYLTK